MQRITKDGYVQLDMVVEKQERRYWCWAAVATSVARGFGSKSMAASQCQLANHFHKQKNCCTSDGKLPKCNKRFSTGTALNYVGHLKWDGNVRLQPSEIRDEIDAGFPVVLALLSRKLGRHAVVIIGYSHHDDRFLVRDPANKAFAKLTYDELVQFAGTYEWIGSRTTKPHDPFRRPVPGLQTVIELETLDETRPRIRGMQVYTETIEDPVQAKDSPNVDPETVFDSMPFYEVDIEASRNGGKVELRLLGQVAFRESKPQPRRDGRLFESIEVSYRPDGKSDMHLLLGDDERLVHLENLRKERKRDISSVVLRQCFFQGVSYVDDDGRHFIALDTAFEPFEPGVRMDEQLFLKNIIEYSDTQESTEDW